MHFSQLTTVCVCVCPYALRNCRLWKKKINDYQRQQRFTLLIPRNQWETIRAKQLYADCKPRSLIFSNAHLVTFWKSTLWAEKKKINYIFLKCIYVYNVIGEYSLIPYNKNPIVIFFLNFRTLVKKLNANKSLISGIWTNP